MSTGTVIPQGYSTVEDSNGNAVAGALVWTYASGTTTPQATYTSDALTVPSSNPIVADGAGRFVAYAAPGTSYTLVYETPATPPTHGSVIITIDNVIAGAVPSQAGTVTGTAGESLGAGKVVFLSDGASGNTAGRWYLATSSTPAFALHVPLGMTASAIASSASGTIILLGAVTGLAGLTPGAPYYLGTAGGLLTAPPSGTLNIRIGTADSASSLVLEQPAARVPATAVLANAVNVTVTNTVAQTQILNTSIPANTLGTYRMIRVTIAGLYTNAGAGNSTFTLDASYGGQLFLSASVGSYATGTTGPTSIVATLNATSVTAQCAYTVMAMPQSAVIQSVNTINAFLPLQAFNNTLTVNSAIAQGLIVAVTHSLGAGVTYQMFSATVELIGQ